MNPRGFGAQAVLRADRIALCSGLAEVTEATLRAILSSPAVGRPDLPVVPGATAGPIIGRTVWVVLDDRTLEPEVAACAARATALAAPMAAALEDQFGEGADQRRLESIQSNPFNAAVLTTPPFHSSRFLYGDRDAAAVVFSRLDGPDLRAEVASGLLGLRPGTCDAPAACGL